MGAAIRYLLNHQVALRRFLDDGRVPIDNGIVEGLHVRTALTRKNFLFAGSDTGAERAAIAYTVLGCCELADVDPVEYLTDVRPRRAAVRRAGAPAGSMEGGACRRCGVRGILNSTALGVGPGRLSSRAMPHRDEDPTTIIVSAPELALLKKLDFPCSERVLATARRDPEGILLHGSHADLSSLAGWVAGEANHSRPGTRRAELLYSLAEQLECVLVVCGR